MRFSKLLFTVFVISAIAITVLFLAKDSQDIYTAMTLIVTAVVLATIYVFRRKNLIQNKILFQSSDSILDTGGLVIIEKEGEDLFGIWIEFDLNLNIGQTYKVYLFGLDSHILHQPWIDISKLNTHTKTKYYGMDRRQEIFHKNEVLQIPTMRAFIAYENILQTHGGSMIDNHPWIMNRDFLSTYLKIFKIVDGKTLKNFKK